VRRDDLKVPHGAACFTSLPGTSRKSMEIYGKIKKTKETSIFQPSNLCKKGFYHFIPDLLCYVVGLFRSSCDSSCLFHMTFTQDPNIPSHPKPSQAGKDKASAKVATDPWPEGPEDG